MTTLYLIGALMALVATLFVALPLLRGAKQSAAPAQDAANVAIYSDQLAELENDLKNGLLTQQQYDHAKPELERRLLQDVSASGTAVPAATQATPRWVGIIASVLVPIIAGGVYFLIGQPEAIEPSVFAQPSQDTAQDPQQQQIEAMLPQIEQRLKEQPDDIAAWTMLGRVMMALQRFPEAAQAYEKVTQITPQSAQAFADYADALGMVQDQKLAGKPTQLIAQALKLDPKNHKALYLSGFAAIEAGNNKAAITQWEKLLAELPPEQKGVDKLREQIAELRQQAGLPEAVAEKKPVAVATAASISGQARLSPTLKNLANPEDTVFVFARAVSGPRMPLAMLRVQVKDLPVDFNLDDSMGMTPQMKLSDFPEVVIVARVSKAGSAIPQPGDLEGVSAPVKLGTRNLKIEISRKIE
jgi:cytochrome c-type biogenesis protein CcmH